MLLTVKPLSVVDSSIRPLENSMTFFLVIDIASLVLPAIEPAESSLSMHHIVLPLTFVAPLVRPDIDTMAFHTIFKEISAKAAAIQPRKASNTVLHTILILTFINCAVCPNFLTLSLMLVIDPLTFIIGTICMMIYTLATRFTIFPKADIELSISMDHSTKSILTIINEETIITCPVRPNLSSTTMSFFACPFANILHKIGKNDFGSELYGEACLNEKVYAIFIIPYEFF